MTDLILQIFKENRLKKDYVKINEKKGMKQQIGKVNWGKVENMTMAASMCDKLNIIYFWDNLTLSWNAEKVENLSRWIPVYPGKLHFSLDNFQFIWIIFQFVWIVFQFFLIIFNLPG